MKTTPRTSRQTKTARIEARVTSGDKRLVMRAAARRGVSVTRFILDAAKAEVSRSPQPQEIVISSEAARAIASALTSPAEANTRLKTAIAKHREIDFS